MSALATSTQAPSLGEFIASHQSELRTAMACALRGRGDVDDALQQAYLRLINEYDRWPAEQTPQERLSFAYRTIQLAAKDALRQAFGRSDRAPRPREVSVDFTSEGREDNGASSATPIQLLAQERLSEAASRYPGDDEHLDSALKVAALAALDPVAHQIVTASELGLNHKQVAKQLGLTHQTVRAKDSEARALLLSLLACARGRDIREANDINLFGYLEGQKVSRAERRLVQGHLKHCANCQEIAALAGQVDTLAKRLVLPIPLMLAATGAAGHLVGVKGSALASGPGGASATSGAGGGTSGLAPVGAAKLATGLAIVALVGGGGSFVVGHHNERRPRVPPGRGLPSAALAVSPQPKALPIARPHRTPGNAAAKHHRRRHPPKSHRVAAKSSAQPINASRIPPAASQPTTATRTQSPPAGSPGPHPPGGEFVLGG